MALKIKSISVDPKRVKAGPDDGLEEGQFIVYPSTFTKEPDSYGDIVAPGAFLKTLGEWQASGNVLPGLYGHRMDDPDYFVAWADEYGEDQHGWWVKGTFDLDHPKAVQTYKLVKGRRISQLSFAYDEIDAEIVELEDGRKANQLNEVKVYEFSFVPVGANQDTSVVAIKGAVDMLRSNTLLAKAGRVLSAKNERALREAYEQIGAVLASVSSNEEDDPGSSDDEKSAGATSQTEEASGTTSASSAAASSEGSGSVVEDSSPAKSVRRDPLAALIRIHLAQG